MATISTLLGLRVDSRLGRRDVADRQDCAGLQAMAAGADRSQQEAAAVDHGIERIGARAVASGFVGIRVGLARVREVLGQARSQLTGAAGALGEASRSVGTVAQRSSPRETITAGNGAGSCIWGWWSPRARGAGPRDAAGRGRTGSSPRARGAVGARALPWRGVGIPPPRARGAGPPHRPGDVDVRITPACARSRFSTSVTQ